MDGPPRQKIAFATFEMQGGSIVLANGAPIAIFTLLLQERLALHSDLAELVVPLLASPAISFLQPICIWFYANTYEKFYPSLSKYYL